MRVNDALEERLTNLLKKKYGFSSFRTGQKEAVMSVANGNNSLVMLPTGTGKSLCYQLPSYLFKGKTIVISPLLSLMEDQVEKMKRDGEKAVVALNSFMSRDEKRKILNQLYKFKFIFLSPEMILQERVLNRLKHMKISLLVIDEAHCISQWGMDFRPDYLKLGAVRKELNNPLTMALTATAVKKVREEIIKQLDLTDQVNEIIYSVNRPSIQLRVEECFGDKDERLIRRVEEFKGPGIIYFTSKKLADNMAAVIRSQTPYSAESYHSAIASEDKRRIQSQFLENRIQIICATSAFGMGIDKPDIRFVIHYHLPANPEAYLQELGRASRDKEGGVALLLYERGDEYIQKRLQEGSLPTRDELFFCYKNPEILSTLNEESKIDIARHFIAEKRDKESAWQLISERLSRKQDQLNFMIEYANTATCKREFLLRYFDEVNRQDGEMCCTNCNSQLLLPYTPLDFSENLRTVEDRNWEIMFKNLFNLESKPI